MHIWEGKVKRSKVCGVGGPRDFFLPYFLYFFAIGSKNLGFRLAARLALEPAGQPI